MPHSRAHRAGPTCALALSSVWVWSASKRSSWVCKSLTMRSASALYLHTNAAGASHEAVMEGMPLPSRTFSRQPVAQDCRTLHTGSVQ